MQGPLEAMDMSKMPKVLLTMMTASTPASPTFILPTIRSTKHFKKMCKLVVKNSRRLPSKSPKPN